MTVARAKQIARRWVLKEAKSLSGFQGAYFAGSVNWMNDDAPLPVTSDIDIAMVLEADEVACFFAATDVIDLDLGRYGVRV